MPPTPRSVPTAFTALAVIVTLSLTATPALADEGGPSEPPGSVSSAAPPEVDGGAGGLRLEPGAQLAPAKVLDIKSVVEDLGGEERREDTPESVTLALQAEVLFPKNSSRLNPEAKSRIAAIAEEIAGQQATTVRVFGFTDNLGSYTHGEKLSKDRADQVQRELAAHLGPDVSYEVRGYSEDYPIADNSTEEGRRKNRRVEVTFQKAPSPDISASAPSA
ncbi:OmpA family protein [Streptomyces sp. UH6]|uniref:OmpA family protein n=1 Tax=Streptomyces sp. UH6 TaxID=2748379 RepID=UPI0015D4FE51|nr:OmpA family protein [Streptomyces sp. UH6]NYV74482.1 OmpA family protein [Streptomyces sp. UH6]